MNIGHLIKPVGILGFAGDMDTKVENLFYDSRAVIPNGMFVAIKGFDTDGHLYLKDSVKNGASALVIQDKAVWEDSAFRQYLKDRGVSLCLVPDTRFALAVMADEFYGNPSTRLRLIGVTGTNGKTTTCSLISKILESSGEKVGTITTVDYRIGQDILTSSRTTPESLDLHRYLSMMVSIGCGWAVLEVSSHSLALQRVAGCRFECAVLTNITRDHLDFHNTVDEYRKAKARLFEMLDGGPAGNNINRLAVFNMDDPASRKILDARKARGKFGSLTMTYGLDNGVDIMARDIVESRDGVRFEALTPWGGLSIDSPLIGRHNVYNILAAVCVTMGFGADIKDVMEGIKAMPGVPGRFERIKLGQPFDVIVDYAHTDDALTKLLRTARNYSDGRVICVFGCGGDRDRTKRPLMGGVAAKEADWSILTSDNPRKEDPYGIVREIEDGFLKEKSGGYEVCIDRKVAIQRAISMAEKGDMIVIAGKGHETTQIIGGVVYPFDDREVARQAISDLITSNPHDLTVTTRHEN
ncbi:UDP-N-acetylmuramoyl-L-alanyl-D-glutamate--2,6-diaminopimelate ligase [bacterium]|nr:UDP-N-acetylmuramoyl-L-alanyl-D-glutamate--2,6-diaminopimelate ligase [bacterium]